MTDNKFSMRRTLPPWLSGPWGKITVFFALYILVYLGWIAFHWGGEENVTLIGDLAYLPVDLIAVIAAWRVFTQKDLDPRIRRMWLLLGLAIFSYFMGDLIWSYFENVLMIQPFPSVADLFYLLFAPLAALGLFSMPGAPLNRRERWRYFFDIFIIMTTSGVLMWYFIIQPTAESNAGDLLTQAIAVAYPVTDFIVISSIVGALLRQPDRDTRSVLWFLFAGMVFFVSADIVYTYTSLAGTYATGSWVDAGWILAQFTFMVAALRQKYQAPAELQNSRLASLQDNFVRMLPTIAVAAGAFVAIGTVVTNYQTQAGWLMSGALVILLLFVVRQFINIQTSSFRNRLAWSFVLLSSLTMAVILTGSFIRFRQQSRESYKQRVTELVSLAALQQDGDAFLTISSENDAEFQRVRAQNLAIKRSSPDIAFVYTMRYDEQGLYFVVDAGEPNDPGLASFGERYEDPSPVLAAAYRTLTKTLADEDIYTDIYGSFLGGYAPIWKKDGQIAGIIGVDIAADKVLTSERDFLLTNIGLFALTLPLIALLGWFLGNSLASPIQKLARATTQISTGDLTYKPITTTVPEIQLLNQAFSEMTQQLRGLIENLETRVRERTKALATSTEVGRRLTAILDPRQLASEVVNQVGTTFNYYHAQIYLFDATGENLVLTAGTGEAGAAMLKRGHAVPKGRGLVGRAAENNRSVLVPDTSQDPDWLPNELLPETKAEAAIPIAIGDKVLGVLDVQDNVTNDITPDDITLLESLASQVAISLQNAELYARAEAALQDARSLIENAPEAVVVVDLTTGLFADPNENAVKLYGLQRDELVKVGPAQMSPPNQPDGRDAAEAAKEKIDKAMQSGTQVFDWVIRNAQGQDVPCEVRLVPMPGRRPRVRASITDITERKHLQELTAQRAHQQEAINLITQRIQSASTIEGAMQVAARELGRALGQKTTLVALEPKAFYSSSQARVNPQTLSDESETVGTGVS